MRLVQQILNRDGCSNGTRRFWLLWNWFLDRGCNGYVLYNWICNHYWRASKSKCGCFALRGRKRAWCVAWNRWRTTFWGNLRITVMETDWVIMFTTLWGMCMVVIMENSWWMFVLFHFHASYRVKNGIGWHASNSTHLSRLGNLRSMRGLENSTSLLHYGAVWSHSHGYESIQWGKAWNWRKGLSHVVFLCLVLVP